MIDYTGEINIRPEASTEEVDLREVTLRVARLIDKVAYLERENSRLKSRIDSVEAMIRSSQ